MDNPPREASAAAVEQVHSALPAEVGGHASREQPVSVRPDMLNG